MGVVLCARHGDGILDLPWKSEGPTFAFLRILLNADLTLRTQCSPGL